MLHPEYFDNKADRLVELYQELEDFIQQDIAKRLLKAGELTATADRLLFKLEQSGKSRDAIERRLMELTRMSRQELRKILQESVLTSWKDDAAVLKDMGVKEVSSPLENPVVVRLMDAQYQKSLGELYNLTRTTANQSQMDLLRLMDAAEMRTSSGSQSYTQAICEVLDQYAGKGVMVDYPSGSKRTLEAAVRCCVVTSMNQTAAQITNHYIAESECEYVLISAHLGARTKQPGQPDLADHNIWQGKPYKIRGSEPGFPNLLDSTGYDIDHVSGVGTVANPLGLHGYNCRHGHQPWAKNLRNPWIDENGRPIIDSDESKRRYNLSQRQRAMERAIRASKRKILIKQQELEFIKEGPEKSRLQSDFERLSIRLTNQNRMYNDFCRDNNLVPQYDRNKVKGYGRSEQSYVNAAYRRAKG